MSYNVETKSIRLVGHATKVLIASPTTCGSNAFQDYFDDAKDSSQESRVKQVSRIKESFNQDSRFK